MASATDFVQLIKAGSATSNDAVIVGDVSFLIDQDPGGNQVTLFRRSFPKAQVEVPDGDTISQHIAAGDTLRVYIWSFDPTWDQVLELFAYNNANGTSVTATAKITITGADVGYNTFTITQVFIDELVLFDPGVGDDRFSVRIAPTNLTGNAAVVISSIDDTFTGAGGTGQGNSYAIGVAIAGAQGSAKRPGNSSVIGRAISSSTAGANRPGNSSVVAKALATSTGGAKRLGNSSVIALALSTSMGIRTRGGQSSVVGRALASSSGSIVGETQPGFSSVIAKAIATSTGSVKRLGNSSVTAVALATSVPSRKRNAFSSAIAKALSSSSGGATRQGNSSVVGVAVATSVGGRTGTIQIDKEDDQVLNTSMESLTLISTGTEWFVI